MNDWVVAVYYDNTKTTIDGGLVTSGTIQVAGDNNSILAGMTAETYAKETCPVDTGYAHNSITHALAGESAAISSYKADRGKNGKPPKTGKYSGTMGKIEDNYVVIGSNVEYFIFIEEGTRVEIRDNSLKDWAEIEIADGKVGWIQKKHFVLHNTDDCQKNNALLL